MREDKKLSIILKCVAFFEKLKIERGIYYICGSDTLPPPLSKEDEEFYIKSIDDEKSKSTLIEHNLRLVVYIARKFENTGVFLEDLISIGTIGLIKAVNTFSPEKNIKLATYASRCIENEILMYLRKNSSKKTEISLDEPLNTDIDGNELLLCDILGSDTEVDSNLDKEAEIEILFNAIKKLSKREKRIMDLRFGLSGGREKTQKEVADMLGISQSYISRLEKRIISRLKKDILKNAQ